MNKIAAIINNIENAIEIKDYVDAFLLPVKNLSINYPNTFTLDEIKKIKDLNKEIFIILNKNIHNNELEKLTETLNKIEKLNINGIIFYDIALVNLKQKLNLKTSLVWHQEHLTTNYGTVNYWYEKGVTSAYLSSELTKREIDEIKNNTKAKIFINVFGYIPMFTSKRHLVQNYLDTFKLNTKNNHNTIIKEGKTYMINDTKEGTTVYSNYILNPKDENLNADYLVFNSSFIDNKDFKEVLKNKENKFPKETGFLYKETIYKVK